MNKYFKSIIFHSRLYILNKIQNKNFSRTQTKGLPNDTKVLNTGKTNLQK